MSITIERGRLGNQIIRNLATHFIAKKFNLYVNYSSYDKIKKLGIELYSGENKYLTIINLNSNNFFEILNKKEFNSNVNSNNDFFQTKEITNYINDYLYNNKESIMLANNYNNRYNNNNDLFLHVRVDDAEKWNPGTEYYLEAIQKINIDITNSNIYLASDNINSNIVKSIINKYNNIIIIDYDEINTIMFGSTCKHIILSHGSFSAIIGYLSFFSNIYYPKYSRANVMWFGDVSNIRNWIEV